MATLSESRKKANAKWDKDNMTIVACKVRKDYAERIKAAAARNGETVNAIIKRSLDAYLEEHDPI